MDPRIPKGIQEISADIVQEKPDVRVDDLDRMPGSLNPNIPSALQGIDDSGIDHEKGLLESAKDKITGTYEAVKEKASDLVYGHHEKSASEQIRDMGQATQKKIEDINEASKEYLESAGGKMKSAGEYLQQKSQSKESCGNTSDAIKKYAEISADKLSDMCEASKEYMNTAGEKMKDAGDYLQKKA